MFTDYDKWPEAVELIRSTTSGGANSFWWQDLATGVSTILDIGIENRVDIFERAGRLVRSTYPNIKKVWEKPFTEVELKHILHLMVLEFEWCIEHLPAPEPKATGKRGKKGATPGPIEGAPLPPPPATL